MRKPALIHQMMDHIKFKFKAEKGFKKPWWCTVLLQQCEKYNNADWQEATVHSQRHCTLSSVEARNKPFSVWKSEASSQTQQLAALIYYIEKIIHSTALHLSLNVFIKCMFVACFKNKTLTSQGPCVFLKSFLGTL